MSEVLRVWVPFLPPSSNKIYEPVWVRGKPMGKRLSTAGRRFKVRAMKVIQEGGRAALLNLKEHIPYELTLAVFLEKVENKGWASGAAENRYAKIDVTNRIKLIEDTVADAVGVDDRHNFKILLEKHCDPDYPGLYVILAEVSEKEVGLTKEQYEIRIRQPEHRRAGGLGLEERDLIPSPRTETGDPDRSYRGMLRPGRSPSRSGG